MSRPCDPGATLPAPKTTTGPGFPSGNQPGEGAGRDLAKRFGLAFALGSSIEATVAGKHVVRRIRANWPRVEILIRGDSHYCRPEVMAWCEANGVSYIFGLGGNATLYAMVGVTAFQVFGQPHTATQRYIEGSSDAKRLLVRMT